MKVDSNQNQIIEDSHWIDQIPDPECQVRKMDPVLKAIVTFITFCFAAFFIFLVIRAMYKA